MKKIIIGSRGSQLSLKQVDIVKKKLLTLDPNLHIEIKIIHTKGDKNMNPIPLDSIGKGWFTKEIDQQTLDGSIDLAVHSLKDLPESLPNGLIIAAIPEREDPREVLVSNNGLTLEKLSTGAIIGTDSNRRKSQILQMRPDLIIKSIRGNVNTRLSKLENGEYDALLLAAAGLKRLQFEKKITQYFPLTDFIPSPGQGALAIVIKETQNDLVEFLKGLNDQATIHAVTAERSFSAAIGGGCKTPVGAYAKTEKGEIQLYGIVGSLDGTKQAKDSIEGPIKDAKELGEKLAKKLLKASSSWYEKSVKYVVITRSPSQNLIFKQQLENLGYPVLDYPCIETKNANLSQSSQIALKQIPSYDWLIFTSQKGINAFIQALSNQQINQNLLKQLKIAAVGQKTAEAIKRYGLSVSFIPSHFTTKDLAAEIPNIQGKKLLLPRANIASKLLTKSLEKRGALVTNIAIYNTQYQQSDSQIMQQLVLADKIGYITFTSPSTVKGFLLSLTGIHANKDALLKQIQKIPVISIGPVTTQAAQKAGFTNITTAAPHTIEGIIESLTQIASNKLDI